MTEHERGAHDVTANPAVLEVVDVRPTHADRADLNQHLPRPGRGMSRSSTISSRGPLSTLARIDSVIWRCWQETTSPTTPTSTAPSNAIALVQSGAVDLDSLVTGHVDLDHAEDALAPDPEAQHVKLVVHPGGR